VCLSVSVCECVYVSVCVYRLLLFATSRFCGRRDRVILSIPYSGGGQREELKPLRIGLCGNGKRNIFEEQSRRRADEDNDVDVIEAEENEVEL